MMRFSGLKILLIILFVWALPLSMSAQKKQIAQAREWVKNKKDLEKAEKSMRILLEDSQNRNNHKIWITLINSLVAQYEQGNEKLYLKQEYDMSQLFNITKRMFDTMEAYDSIDVLPNKKGKIDPKFRESHSIFLNKIRTNLYLGGVFFLNKKDYKQSMAFMEEYIECANHPLFEKYQYATTDTLLQYAARWAMYSGIKLNVPDAVLKYKTLAERDIKHYEFVLQYLAEAYDLKQMKKEYIETLQTGFDKYPTFPFFFPRLMDYYQSENKLDSALNIANKALEADSTNIMFQYAKSTILLNTGHYDECIKLCQKLIEKDDSLAEAYYNIGLAYFDQAIELDKVQQKSRDKRKRIMTLYKESLPYLEKYRLLAPEQKAQWVSPLYTIYLNLNMGKEFDEIDKIKNEYRNNHR